MPAKRIIPCLDVDDGRVVKGVRFQNLRDAGDPAELAALYDREGADEVVFLDITASSEHRSILLDAAARTADEGFIPLTVVIGGRAGGGRLGRARAVDRLRRRRHGGAHVRGPDRRRRRGRAGSIDLPFRRAVDPRRQGGPGGARARDQAMKPDFSKGLVPAVVQDVDTGKVLMLAYMDEEAWTKTRETGRAWFHSRTRGLWEKGGTSGNLMLVIETRLD